MTEQQPTSCSLFSFLVPWSLQLFPGLIRPTMLEHMPCVRIDSAPISRNMDERTIRFELERHACRSLRQGGVPVVCHASTVQTVQHDFALSVLDQCLGYTGSREKNAVHVSIQAMLSDFIRCKNWLFQVCRPSSVSSSCIFWAQVLSGSNTQILWLDYSWDLSSPGTAHFALST